MNRGKRKEIPGILKVIDKETGKIKEIIGYVRTQKDGKRMFFPIFVKDEGYQTPLNDNLATSQRKWSGVFFEESYMVQAKPQRAYRPVKFTYENNVVDFQEALQKRKRKFQLFELA